MQFFHQSTIVQPQQGILLNPQAGKDEAATPGVQCYDNATVLLSDDDEVQPDLCLRILPEYGGQSRNADVYIKGAPELIMEVTWSTRSLDLHVKRQHYERAGVVEYAVICLCPLQIQWFDLRSNRAFASDDDGAFRSVAASRIELRRTCILLWGRPTGSQT